MLPIPEPEEGALWWLLSPLPHRALPHLPSRGLAPSPAKQSPHRALAATGPRQEQVWHSTWSQALPCHGHSYYRGWGTSHSWPSLPQVGQEKQPTTEAGRASSKHGPAWLREPHVKFLSSRGCRERFTSSPGRGGGNVLPSRRCQTTLSTALLLPVNPNPAGNI